MLVVNNPDATSVSASPTPKTLTKAQALIGVRESNHASTNSEDLKQNSTVIVLPSPCFGGEASETAAALTAAAAAAASASIVVSVSVVAAVEIGVVGVDRGGVPNGMGSRVYTRRPLRRTPRRSNQIRKLEVKNDEASA
ncbi:hypothetical protein AKJ16_DCAP12595 [Drosera capensis]